jgi:hypothetical protein
MKARNYTMEDFVGAVLRSREFRTEAIVCKSGNGLVAIVTNNTNIGKIGQVFSGATFDWLSAVMAKDTSKYEEACDWTLTLVEDDIKDMFKPVLPAIKSKNRF